MRWIERNEIGLGHFGQLCGTLQVDGVSQRNGFEVGLVGYGCNGETEGSRIANDVLNGLQFGQVVARLGRHVERKVGARTAACF